MINVLKGMLRTGMVMGLSGMLFVSCSKHESDAPEPEVARPVRVLVIREESQSVAKMYPAKTGADQTVDVAFEVPGKIIELPISRGMKVAKDQILARLDAREYENEVAAKKAERVKAQAELERYRKMYEDDVVTLQELQVRERDLNVADARLKTAEKALQDTVLKAPFEGIVATKYVENFQAVSVNMPVARIQNNDAIEIVINVPERDIASGIRKIEFKAQARFEVVPDREFDLTLKEFETEADPVTQTFSIKFSMPNPSDVKILPGMSAMVSLQLDSQKTGGQDGGLIIPSSAVAAGADGTSYVWLVNSQDQTVSKRLVQLGQITGTESVRILSGLKAGDVIAVSGIYHLQEGMRIQPKELGAEMVK